MPENPGSPRPESRRVLRIGLTGGIASGKSAVASAFSALGIPVIDTDVIAREVVGPGTAGLGQVTGIFGPEVVDATGHLDRKRLRTLVFNDPGVRHRLEAVLHPLIRRTMEAKAAAAGGPYQLLVIPLLVESGLRSSVDRVLVVDCPEDMQIERLMRRDRSDAAEARAILAAQTSREARLSQADDVIVNDTDLETLEKKVRELDACYRNLAQARAVRA